MIRVRWVNKLKVKRLELIQGASSASINQISVSPCCSSACSHDTCIFSILCLHSSILENTRERVGDVGTKYNDYEMIYRQADLFHSDHETTTEPRDDATEFVPYCRLFVGENKRNRKGESTSRERERKRRGLFFETTTLRKSWNFLEKEIKERKRNDDFFFSPLFLHCRRIFLKFERK